MRADSAGSVPPGRRRRWRCDNRAFSCWLLDASRRPRAGLRTAERCRVLDLRLEGPTREEIAQRLRCAERTV